MNTSNLMLGDWVKYGNQYIKVASITKKKIGYHIKPNEPRMHYVRVCEVEPIPLTPETLVKNGFSFDEEETNSDIQSVYKDYTEFYKFPLGKGFYIEYNTVTKDFWITDHCWIQFKYFNEFQHVLRMCGIKKEIEL